MKKMITYTQFYCTQPSKNTYIILQQYSSVDSSLARVLDLEKRTKAAMDALDTFSYTRKSHPTQKQSPSFWERLRFA